MRVFSPLETSSESELSSVIDAAIEDSGVKYYKDLPVVLIDNKTAECEE
uniref:Uncharacterized protein n=1 Tax=Romanomermis culicivorax TaxID=13658 RepID=A0A915KM29_ROMCU